MGSREHGETPGRRHWAALCVIVLSSCTVDRTPQEDEQAWLPGVPNHEAADKTVGGLSCGGQFCPFTVQQLAPCCTDADDVSSNRALDADRCGVDFGGRTASIAGQCWQRDQPGVPEDSCPSQQPVNAVLEESGCCTIGGVCGSFNVHDAIGCHQNAGVTTSCDSDINDRITCDPFGMYAVRVEIDVYWGGRTGGFAELTDDGRGLLVVYLGMAIGQQSAPGVRDGFIKPCGVEILPFYSSTLCETYVPLFPDAVWDSPSVPVTQVQVTYQCLHPGCLLNIEPGVGLIGIDMDNPEALWPTASETTSLACTAGMGESCFPDIDEDGHPAVTLELVTTGAVPPPAGTMGNCAGFNRRAAPISEDLGALFDTTGTGDGVRRADRMFLGTRIKLGGATKISDDCTTGVGVGLAEFIQARAWGCMLKPGSGVNAFSTGAGSDEECTLMEGRFLDENLPIYRILLRGETPDPGLNVPQHASDGPIYSTVRIGTSLTPPACQVIRSTAFP